MSFVSRSVAVAAAIVAIVAAAPPGAWDAVPGFSTAAKADEICSRSAGAAGCPEDGDRNHDDDDRCAAGAPTAGIVAVTSRDRDPEENDCRSGGEIEDDADRDDRRMASGRPVNGWWWNAGQAGRGYSIEMHEGRLFLGAFLYDQDGRAMWVTSTGRMTDPFHYVGRLVLHGDGPTLEDAGRSTQPRGELGPIRLTFTGPGTGSLTMPDCSVLPLERFSIVAGGAAQSWDGRADGRPATGWYWNASQAGRGFFAEVQGDRLFIAAFMYRSDGSPVWYVADGGLVPGGTRTYTGALHEYRSVAVGGTSLRGGEACAAGVTPAPTPAVAPSQEIGTATVQFRGDGRATVTMPSGERIAVRRFRF